MKNDKIKNLLDQIATNDTDSADVTFCDIMNDKIQDALDVQRIKVASQMFVDLEESSISPANGSVKRLNVELDSSHSKILSKYSIKGSVKDGLTGSKKDIFKFLTSKDYGLEPEEVKGLYPELFK